MCRQKYNDYKIAIENNNNNKFLSHILNNLSHVL